MSRGGGRWHLLGLASDPTPGDVGVLSSIMDGFGDLSRAAGDTREDLADTAAGLAASGWRGPFADGFRAAFAPAPGWLETQKTAAADAVVVLADWVVTMTSHQSQADDLLEQAEQLDAARRANEQQLVYLDAEDDGAAIAAIHEALRHIARQLMSVREAARSLQTTHEEAGDAVGSQLSALGPEAPATVSFGATALANAVASLQGVEDIDGADDVLDADELADLLDASFTQMADSPWSLTPDEKALIEGVLNEVAGDAEDSAALLEAMSGEGLDTAVEGILVSGAADQGFIDGNAGNLGDALQRVIASGSTREAGRAVLETRIDVDAHPVVALVIATAIGVDADIVIAVAEQVLADPDRHNPSFPGAIAFERLNHGGLNGVLVALQPVLEADHPRSTELTAMVVEQVGAMEDPPLLEDPSALVDALAPHLGDAIFSDEDRLTPGVGREVGDGHLQHDEVVDFFENMIDGLSDEEFAEVAQAAAQASLALIDTIPVNGTGTTAGEIANRAGFVLTPFQQAMARVDRADQRNRDILTAAITTAATVGTVASGPVAQGGAAILSAAADLHEPGRAERNSLNETAHELTDPAIAVIIRDDELRGEFSDDIRPEQFEGSRPVLVDGDTWHVDMDTARELEGELLDQLVNGFVLDQAGG